MDEQFILDILARLDTSNIPNEVSEVQKAITKDKTLLKVAFDMSGALSNNRADIKKYASDLFKTIQSVFDAKGVKLNITQKDIEKSLVSSIKDSETKALAEQQKYYNTIKSNTKDINALEQKKIGASSEVTKILQDQINLLERNKKYNESLIVNKGLVNPAKNKEVTNLEKSKAVDLNVKQVTDKESKELLKQKNLYDGIQQNLSEMYSIRGKLLTAGAQETIELNKQLNTLEAKNMKTSAEISSSPTNQNKDLEERNKLLEETYQKELAVKTAKANDSSEEARIKALRTQKSLLAEMDSYKASNSKLFATNSEEAKKLITRFEELELQIKQTGDGKELSGLKSELGILKKEVNALGLSGKSASDVFKAGFEKLKGWASVTAILMTTKRVITDMVKNVYDLDGAMTDLYKVTDNTASEYNVFFDEAVASAKELGVSVRDVIASTADFARLDYSLSEATSLAEVANVYKNVGNIDIDSATKSIISTMKAFNVEATNSITIVDKFNEVGNNFAISSEGIGEAMQRSASALRTAGNDIDQSIALITASNQVVQDPSGVGTAMKTISMRMRGAKTELEDAGESIDGMASSTSKLRGEIMALSGVDIMLDTDTFKSTYDVLDELSVKWESLTDIQRASVTELMSGKRQANVFASLMTNFDVARETMEASLDSEGSAMKENEKHKESLKGMIAEFKAQFEELSSIIANSSVLKTLITWATGFLSGFTKLVDALGSAVPIITVLSAGLVVLKTSLKMLSADTQKQTLNNLLLTASNAGLSASFKALGTAIKTSMATNPLGWVVIGVSALIGLVAWLDKVVPSLENQEKKTEELKTKYNEIATELENVNSQLETTKTRMDELNAKDSLTFVEKEELQNLKYSNDELERKQKLLEEQAKHAQEKVAKSIEGEVTTKFGGVNKERVVSDETRTELGNVRTQIKDIENSMRNASSPMSPEQLKKSNDLLGELYKKEIELEKLTGANSKNHVDTWEWIDQALIRYNELNDKKEQGIALTDSESKEYDNLRSSLVDTAVYLDGKVAEYGISDSVSDGWNDIATAISDTLYKSEKATEEFNKVFKSLDKGVKDELIALAEAGKLTDMDIPKTFVDDLKKVGLEASDATKQLLALYKTKLPTTFFVEDMGLGQILTDLEDGVKLVDEAQLELSESGELNYDTVNKLLKVYPNLESSLEATATGYAVTKGALDDLIASQLVSYQADIDNVVKVALDILEAEGIKQGAYGTTAMSIKGLIEQKIDLLKTQQLELEQAQTKAKAKADAGILGNGILGQSVDQFDSIVLGYMDDKIKTLEDSLTSFKTSIKNAEQNYADALASVERIKAKLKADKDGKKSKGKDKSTTDIDWLEESIETLEQSIGDFDKKLETSKGLESKLAVIKETKTALETLKTTYKKSEGVWQTRYDKYSSKLKEKDVKKIESGEAIDISKYPAEYAKKVEKALEAWRKIKEAKGKVLETQDKLNKKTQEYYQIQLDAGEGKQDTFDNLKQDEQNKIDENNAKGVDPRKNKKSYEEQISINNDSISQNNTDLAIAKAYRADMKKQFKKDSPEYREADAEVQRLQNSTSKLKQENIELNRTILNLPAEHLKKVNEELEAELDVIKKEREEIESSIKFASSLIQDSIDLLNEEKETVTDTYDTKINALNDEKDALQQSNKELENKKNLEQALYDLERAKNQKTVKIYRAGQGFVYEADQSAVRKAQDDVDNARHEVKLEGIDKSIKSLEKTKKEALEKLDAQIKSLETYKEGIDGIADSVQKVLDMQKFIDVFGEDGLDRLLAGDTSFVDEMTSTLNNKKGEELIKEGEITANEEAITKIENITKTWDGTREKMKGIVAEIGEIVTASDKEKEAIKERVKDATKVATAWNKSKKKIDESLLKVLKTHETVNKKEKTKLDDRIKQYKTFRNEAVTLLNEVTSALGEAEAKKAELDKVNKGNNKSSKDNTISTFDYGFEEIGNTASKGTKNAQKGVTLIAEEKPELVWHKNKGTYEYVEKTSLVNLDQGDVVYNGNETTAILNNAKKMKPTQDSALSGIKSLGLDALKSKNMYSDWISKLSSNNTTNGALKADKPTVSSITIGDIHVHEVDSAEDFANEVISQFPNRLKQRLFSN